MNDDFDSVVNRLRAEQEDAHREALQQGISDGTQWARDDARSRELRLISSPDTVHQIAPSAEQVFARLIETAPHIVGMAWNHVPDVDDWDYTSMDEREWDNWRLGFIQGATEVYEIVQRRL